MATTTTTSLFSEEGERGALGAVLQDPGRLMPLLVGKMRVSGEMFYVPRHVVIWDAVVAMWREHRPIDLLTVCDWLQARGKLEGVGGASVLDALVDATPTAAHGEYYAEQVRQKFMCRRIVEVGRDAAEACGMGTAPQEVVAEMMSRHPLLFSAAQVAGVVRELHLELVELVAEHLVKAQLEMVMMQALQTQAVVVAVHFPHQRELIQEVLEHQELLLLDIHPH
jgi:replicative DNA helicase